MPRMELPILCVGLPELAKYSHFPTEDNALACLSDFFVAEEHVGILDKKTDAHGADGIPIDRLACEETETGDGRTKDRSPEAPAR